MLAWIFGVIGLLVAGIGVGGTIRPAGLENKRGSRPKRYATISLGIVGIVIWIISGGAAIIPGGFAFVVAILAIAFGKKTKAKGKPQDHEVAPQAPIPAYDTPQIAIDTKLEELLEEAERIEAEEATARLAKPANIMPVFEPNRPLPEGMVAELPSIDTNETPPLEDTQGIDVGRTVIIDYLDAKGDHSRRQITVRKILNYGDDWAIDAWCHHRRATRTFLLSRIEAMFLPDTGEVIDRPLDFLTGVLHGPEGKVMARLEDDLTVLVYVARSDGQMRANERVVIVDYVVSSCGDTSLDTKVIELEIQNFWNGPGAFYAALRRLKDEPIDRRNALFRSAEAVMLADGKRREGEEKAMRSIRKLLGLSKAAPVVSAADPSGVSPSQ